MNASKKAPPVAAAARGMLAKSGIEAWRHARNCWHTGSGRGGWPSDWRAVRSLSWYARSAWRRGTGLP
ncbi:TPA: hypothetical protein MX214_004457 [Citrobacter sedlakii]|nr:hypothetical protein [Citrobacter sedlakii]HCA7137684.1 hypothetical protein [Citrobacter sedlakii]HCA7183818.1 hypothetical protein [Citrobacter sedlakii]